MHNLSSGIFDNGLGYYTEFAQGIGRYNDLSDKLDAQSGERHLAVLADDVEGKIQSCLRPIRVTSGMKTPSRVTINH